jgi:molybdate transport system substrate-binding protein
MPVQSANSEKKIEVACAGAMKPVITELARAFEQASGSKVSVRFDRSGVVKTRILDGEIADVVITTKAAIDDLARQHKVARDSVVAVAHSGIGVAMRTGAAKPDIGSVASFKRTLLNAKSIACADPATGSPSGNHFVALLRRLGIAAEIAPKLRLVGAAGGSVVVVCEAVAKAEAEIGIQQIAEILPVSGVDLAGPLPKELQQMTIFSAAAGAGAREPDLARRFIAFISSEAAAPAVMASGMECRPL